VGKACVMAWRNGEDDGEVLCTNAIVDRCLTQGMSYEVRRHGLAPRRATSRDGHAETLTSSHPDKMVAHSFDALR
jgi:hypothetical protein